MLPFYMFATPHLRSATSPPSLCVLRELCVKIPPSLNSRCHTSPKISAKLPPQKGRFKSVLYALFQVPYPLSPVFATLTRTAGCTPRIPILVQPERNCGKLAPRQCTQVLSFHILTNSFAHRKIISLVLSRTSALFGKKHPGVGYPSASQVRHFCYSGRPRMIPSSSQRPPNATRKRKPSP